MTFMPRKVRLMLAAIMVCLGVTAVSADITPAKADVGFSIYIGPGYHHGYYPYGYPYYGHYPYYYRPYYYRPYYYYRPRYYRPRHRYKRSRYRRGRWCHVHRFKVRGVKRHRHVRCHKHRHWKHRSIRYVR